MRLRQATCPMKPPKSCRAIRPLPQRCSADWRELLTNPVWAACFWPMPLGGFWRTPGRWPPLWWWSMRRTIAQGFLSKARLHSVRRLRPEIVSSGEDDCRSGATICAMKSSSSCFSVRHLSINHAVRSGPVSHPSWTATSSSRNHFWRPIADVCARAYARKLRRCDVVSGPIQSHGHPDLATLRRLMTGEHQGDQTGHPPQNRHPPAARGPRRNSLTSSRTQDRRRGGRFICLSSACESVSRGPSKSAGCVNPALPLINFFSLNPQLLQLTVKFRDS